MKVDLCTCCKGAWLDGDECGELVLLRNAKGGVKRKAGAYRRNAARAAIDTGEAKCVQCQAVTPIEEMAMWESGLMCQACFDKADLRRASARAKDAQPGVIAKFARALFLSLKKYYEWEQRNRSSYY